MVKNNKVILYALLSTTLGFYHVQAKAAANPKAGMHHERLSSKLPNTVLSKSKNGGAPMQDTVKLVVKTTFVKKGKGDTLEIGQLRNVPNLSLQQMLKGQVAGLYVQEPTAEPGTEQNMVLQGISAPIFTKRDVYSQQPAVYLNGIYLVQDNPFAYDVQKYDYNRIGPATNLLTNIDIDNIQSIEVIKDPVALAKLGPNAVNGAIWITTKAAKSGLRQISINSFGGIVPAENVQTTNGVFENDFRKPFYQKYATKANYDAYASFLRDSTNLDYFGSSNWNDLYYKNTAVFGANLGITGGTERANFRFYGTGVHNASNADNTALDKFNAFFNINMMPFTWLTVSSFLNASRIDRFRNRSLRDRFAEVRYIPDLSNPLSPNRGNYQLFLDEYAKVLDDNRTNLVNGSLALNFGITKQLNLNSAVVFDYNEGIRNAFYPSTLMDGVNYVSGFFGYNQRFGWNNTLSYDLELNKEHAFRFELGQSMQDDLYRYNYQRGYDGNSDFIKINVVNGNPGASNYLNAIGNFYLFRYTDKLRHKLLSVYGAAKYTYKDWLTANVVLRHDGTSYGQPDSRWMTTPAFSLDWNIKNHLLSSNKFFNHLSLNAAWARSTRIFLDDRFGAGPQYRTEYGWYEEPTIPTFGGFQGISRPYNSGWVGYELTLPYSDRFSLGASATALNNRLSLGLTFYNRDDKNQLVNLPLSAESGYTSIFKNGMWVNNKGLEVLLSGNVLQSKNSISWTTGVNLAFNKNTLKALPGGVQDLIIGDNKLKVGESVGAYWLYSNKGIYQTDAEVPVNPNTNQKLSFNGIALKAGDPKWVDYNGDYNINEADKRFVGDRMPSFTGGWNNEFKYKNFNLNFHFFFALGQKLINQFDATRYDFINKEAAIDINSIREITAWQTHDKLKTYPIYNVWSNVVPYRSDQDLFLEDASYLKLRSVTLGYDLAMSKFATKKQLGFRRAYIYATASNLFTITNFTGTDPELANFNGYYDGTGMPISRVFTLGLKLEL